MDPVGVNFFLNFENVYENVEAQEHLRLEYRFIRDTSDPFQMAEEKFVKLFRLNKVAVLDLIPELQEFSNYTARENKIPFHFQVLTCLNFYANGSYQTTVGQDLNLTISQPVVSKIINDLSTIFAINLLPRYVRFPTTEEEISNVKQGFSNKFNFPNIVGVIDCTHIAIISPPEGNDLNPPICYLNRKGYYSINVQAVCDSDMLFLNINARYPGATHDAAIWEVSTINRFLKRRYTEQHQSMWLLGDSGYPLQPWMMTPIPEAAPNTPEGRYTKLHCRTRNVIERGFGVLKQRFKCLLKHRTLHYGHTTAGKIIYACVVLHNICIKRNISNLDEELEDQLPLFPPELEVLNRDDYDNDFLTQGRMIRRTLINSLEE